MELVADSTSDFAIITLDAEGRITGWNHGAQAIFGYAKEEIVGRAGAELFTASDRAHHAPEEELHRARLYGRAEDERWHVRKDGSACYLSGVVTRLATEQRGQPGFVKIARDLTHSKHHEQRREAQLLHERLERIQAQAKSALKDEFLAIMSHELKHPLNLIHANAELLVRLPEVQGAPAARRAADTICRTVTSQAKIIDDLLDLSRLHTGKLTLQRGPVALQEVAHTIVDALGADVAARQIRIDYDPGPEPVVVFADQMRVEQMVWNLLSNAIKFTPASGHITVRLANEQDQGVLTVSDTGRGIDRETLPHIFDMFRQAETRAARHEGGLGIGLALIRQLCDAHGGSVSASSGGPGLGSTFTVRLPRHAPLPLTPGTTAPEEEYATPTGLTGLRILMVDDTRDTLEAFGELLKMEGAHFHGATSGTLALGWLARHDCDLILSDLAMPGMTGFEFIARVRADPGLAHIPAIALSGYGREDDTRRALDQGFSAHLGKPVSLPALLGAVAGLGIHGRSAS